MADAPKISSEEMGRFLEQARDPTTGKPFGHEEGETPADYQYETIERAQRVEKQPGKKLIRGIDVPPRDQYWAYRSRMHPNLRGQSRLTPDFQRLRAPTVAADAPISGDADTLASVLEGEAGGEGRTGMQAVANVIANRARSNFGGHGGLVGQALAPNQFQRRTTPSPAARDLARRLVSGDLEDITGGATFYANPGASQATWARRLNGANAYKIGAHYFTSNTEGVPFHGPGDQIARHMPPIEARRPASSHPASRSVTAQRGAVASSGGRIHHTAVRAAASPQRERIAAAQASMSHFPSSNEGAKGGLASQPEADVQTGPQTGLALRFATRLDVRVTARPA